MLQMASPLILKLSLFLMTAVATHLAMSFGQTFMHYKIAHHPIGGKLFRNHINFHHTHYADDHLVSQTYLGNEGNITPYFFIPVFLFGGRFAYTGSTHMAFARITDCRGRGKQPLNLCLPSRNTGLR